MRKISQKLLVFLMLGAIACKKDNSVNPQDQESLKLADEISAVKVNGISLDGDALTDSRSKLQELVNAAAAKGETLVLPAGKYLISNEIVLPSNTSIEGAGDATEIILTPGNASNRNVFRVPTRTSDIKLKNIRLNANQSQNKGRNVVAYYVTDNTKNIYCENVSFAGGRDGGSVQVKGLNNYPVVGVTFVNCWFVEAGRSSLEFRGSKDVLVKNCYFEKWASQNDLSPAISLQSQDNTNLSIIDNAFVNSYGTLGSIQATAATVKEAKIQNNVFNDSKNMGGNGITGNFVSSAIINNKFGGSKGIKNGNISINGRSNTISPNTFSAQVFPVSAKTITESNPSKPAPAPETIPETTKPQPLPPAPGSKPNATGLIGDGRTDNRSILQNLVNSYASKGQALVLPAGKFLISNEIVLPSNISIEGAGESTEIVLNNGSASNRRVFRIPTRQNNIKLKNLKLNANLNGNRGSQLVAFYVTDNVRSVYCENVTFSGSRDAGTVTVKGLNAYQVNNLSLINCKFTDAGRSLLELRGTKDALITNCEFTRWGLQNPNSPGLQLQSQDNVDVQITRNTFNNTNGVQFGIECAAAYVLNSKITGNQLNDPKNLGGNGISGYYKNTVISNNKLSGGKGNHRSGLEIFGSYNTISNNMISAGAIAISAGKTENATGVVISNNTIKTRGDNVGGIQLGGGSRNLDNIKIANNVIDTRASRGNSSAIVLGTYNATRAVSDITIESNTIYTNAHCIRMQALKGSKNIYIKGNRFKAGYTWLGMITNTFSNIKVTGNVNELSNKNISYSVSMSPIAVQ